MTSRPIIPPNGHPHLMNGGASPSSVAHLKRVEIFQNILALSLRNRFVESMTTAPLRARQKLAHVTTARVGASGHGGGDVLCLVDGGTRGN